MKPFHMPPVKHRIHPFADKRIPNVPPEKVVICGTRTFNDWKLFEEKMDRYTFWFDVIEVVVGGFGERVERGGEWVYRGADFFANQWAERNWWTRKIFEPDWDLGLGAGPKRNREMARYVAPHGWCVAFWNGKSRGTWSMIREFLKLNPEENLRIVRYK